MDTFVSRRVLLKLAALLALPRALGVSISNAATPAGLPTWTAVEEMLKKHFATLPDFESGDLISRKPAKAALDKLVTIGWKLTDEKELLEGVLADDDFLVTALASTNGRRFMRQVSKYKNAYDRLEHLSKLPQGKSKVNELIKTRGGYKMIEYMTTAPGGKELGKMLSAAPHGAGFNKPTGRIYTADLLIAALRERYAKLANRP